jgi:hypothetical protein
VSQALACALALLSFSARLLCVTVIRVHDAIFIQVPEQFAAELAGAGFRRARRPRGGGGGIEPVLTFVVTGAGLAADAATIIVAKDAVSDFVARLRSWIAHRGKPETGSELVIEVSRRSPAADSSIRLVVRWAAGNAAPDLDTQALVTLLGSVFSAGVDPRGPGEDVPPG